MLLQFYIEQYRIASTRNNRKRIKTKGYMHRLNAKARSVSKAIVTPGQENMVSKLHGDVKRLAYLAYYTNNKEAVKVLNKQILPHVVRMDMDLFENDELEQIDQAYIKRLSKEYSGLICNKCLKEIFYYRRQIAIKKQIIKLVPENPEQEFPDSLLMDRRFILHVGPTNSGKTYQALECLKNSNCGVYLGPLRLLALEVYEKMMDYGTPCTMLTGQECIEQAGSKITASTIEMLDISKEYDIAVIDEAQMVADVDRGHSWTRAILGVRAKEIHVCMSPIALDVVTHLIGLTGDTYEINYYERKTPLILAEQPFEFPNDVEDGDAFIVFSKKAVLNIAARLEENGINSSVIYGSLPPEIRRRQLEMFNSGKTKVVVSTDAIGMGLNLPVKRIVFIETEKFDGTQKRPLLLQEVKQIAGRAGRFGIHENGYVTAMGTRNLTYIKKLMGYQEEMLYKVSLGFPRILLDMDAPLDEIVKLWHDVRTPDPFEKINIDEILYLYNVAYKYRTFIADFDDKHILYKMVTCPIDIKDIELVRQWRKYCMTYTADISLKKPSKFSDYHGLAKYESYYKKLDLYYQLSVRLGKIIDQEWLENEREEIQAKIMHLLQKDKNEYILRCRYCGRILAVGSKFNSCEECHNLRRMFR